MFTSRLYWALCKDKVDFFSHGFLIWLGGRGFSTIWQNHASFKHCFWFMFIFMYFFLSYKSIAAKKGNYCLVRLISMWRTVLKCQYIALCGKYVTLLKFGSVKTVKSKDDVVKQKIINHKKLVFYRNFLFFQYVLPLGWNSKLLLFGTVLVHF